MRILKSRGSFVASSIVTALSFAYFIACFWFRRVLLGPDYSDRLFLTLDVNILVTVFAGVCFVLQQRMTLACCTTVLAFLWVFLRAINSVV